MERALAPPRQCPRHVVDQVIRTANRRWNSRWNSRHGFPELPPTRHWECGHREGIRMFVLFGQHRIVGFEASFRPPNDAEADADRSGLLVPSPMALRAINAEATANRERGPAFFWDE